ncbi:MAG TPA: class I SAM-dependent methyltransferase [Candidatus Caenarcaniphilales bacterium]
MVSQTQGCPHWYKRFFSWALANGNAEYEHAIADRKRSLLADLRGDVLEIGPGTGVNLPYYATDIHWIGIEPNPFMHPYLRKEAKKQGLNIDLRSGTAERLEVKDNSVDAVVSTLVLCSVPNLRGTLQEILRVLKPGGRFVFIEHVAAAQGTWLRQIQHTVQPVWKLIGDGCCPDRETGKALDQAGFASVNYQHFEGPFPIPIVKPHIAGVATK